MKRSGAREEVKERRQQEAAAANQPLASEESCHNRAGLRINSRECIDFFKAQRRPSDRDCFLSPACREETEARNAAAHAKHEREDRERTETIRRQYAAEAKQRASMKRSAPVRSSGGCGGRGGPGYRKANGKCASWRD